MLTSQIKYIVLEKFLNDIHPIDDKIVKDYLAHWTKYEVRRNTTITSAGNTERYLYFIENGVCKSYFLNDTKEHIMFFAYPPSFCGVVESFLTQTPSKYYLESITNCEFMRISYAAHRDFIKNHRPLETLFRKLTEQFLLGIIERHHELMAYNAETRFKNFVKRSPHLLNLLSQKDMASYLRIDPTNFSKLINTIKL